MRPGTHPVLVRHNVQERSLPAKLLEEFEFGGMFLGGWDGRGVRIRHKTDSHFRSLNARSLIQKVSERDGIRDLVSGIRVVIRGINAVAKTGECIFYALRSESRQFGAGYEITLLSDSPFARLTHRFDVALELKNCGGFSCLRHRDFERAG